MKNSHLEQQATAHRAEAFKLIEQIKKIGSAPPKGTGDNVKRNRELFRLRREVGRLSRLAANLDAMRLKDYGGCDDAVAHPLRAHAPNAKTARHRSGFPCNTGLTTWHA